MLILLPPSEAKNSVEKGKQLSLGSLSFAKDLTSTRKQTLLGIGTKIASSPAAKACEVYSGVLYQELNYAGLASASKKRAEKSILIISALFGVLKLTDQIPYYKLDMAKSLPKVGSLNSLWKKVLPSVLNKIKTELIIDCRSSTYQGVWVPDLNKIVGIRVFTIKNGKKAVVTHMSKKTRGAVTNFLISQAKDPKTPSQLKTLLSKEFKCELIKPTAKTSWFIDVIAKL
jgi:hypothetical protein